MSIRFTPLALLAVPSVLVQAAAPPAAVASPAALFIVL